MAGKPTIVVDQESEEESKSTEEQASQNDPQDKTEEAPTGGEESTDEDKLWDGISDDHPVRDLVKSLRDEAAAKRTSVKSVREENERLEAALAEAKTDDDVQKAIADWKGKVEEKEAELARERVARRYKISEDFIEFLTGSDEETLEAQAEKLRNAGKTRGAQQKDGDPVGGRNPKSNQPKPADYAEEIRKQRRGRRRR